MRLILAFVLLLLAFTESEAAAFGGGTQRSEHNSIRWKTALNVDCTTSSNAHVGSILSNSYGGTGITWFVDGDGLHMRVVNIGGVYTGKGLYTSAFYPSARVTIWAKVPADRRKGTVFAPAWTVSNYNFENNNLYYELDGIEIAGFDSWGDNKGQSNIHYGLSENDRVWEPVLVDLPFGEFVKYEMEWDNEFSYIRVNNKEVIKKSRYTLYKGQTPMTAPMKVVMSCYCGSWAGTCDIPEGEYDEMIIRSLKIEVPDE